MSKDETSGIVSQINEWKTGKGYFIELEGNPTEYFGFGKPKVKEGQAVVFQTKPGTNNFSLKVELVKLLEETVKTADIINEETKKEVFVKPAPIARNNWEENKQQAIIAQCALKAAATIIAAIYNDREIKDLGMVASQWADLTMDGIKCVKDALNAEA